MRREDREIIVGKITAPFGIRGEVKLTTLTDFPDRFDVGRDVTLRIGEREQKRFRVEKNRPYKGGLVLKLQGVNTRNDAEELRGVEAVIREEELAELGENEYYAFDIIGLNVVTDDGRELGEVTEILQGGANDVYVTSGGICIPALKDVVAQIDIPSGTITVHPVPGLLPEDAENGKQRE